MRDRIISAAFAFLFAAFAAAPAQAGTVMTSDGRVSWATTQCTKPAEPPMPANAETPANQLNGYVVSYNNYVKAEDGYMNCIATEAQHDADTVGHSIIGAVQTSINSDYQNELSLGAELKRQLANAK